MAKYIDTEDLKVYMQTGLTGNGLYTPNGIDEFVESLPVADVEPVVRCKDCKHYKTMFCKMDIWHIDITIYRADEDDYCSYGERKE